MDKSYIFYDLDGTLTDPKEGITKSIQYGLRGVGVEEDNLDNLIKFIGPPLKESFTRYYGFDDAMADAAIVKYREYYSEKGIFQNSLYDGVGNLLAKQHKDGKKIVLATSKPLYYARIILEHFEIEEYFTFASGSEMNGDRVKKAEVIAYAMENCGLTSGKDAIMVGDRMHDIVGAQTMGMDSVAVLYGYGSREELEEQGPTYLVETVAGLGNLLEE